MRVFMAVVQAGRLVQAAQPLDTSEAMVLRLLLELKATLNMRQLNRATHRPQLAEAGNECRKGYRQILEKAIEANAAISASSGFVSGRLKIIAPVTFGSLHVAPLWGEFSKLHTQVELDIALTARVVGQVDEGCDMVVRIALLAHSSLVSRTLAHEELPLYASSATPRLRANIGDTCRAGRPGPDLTARILVGNDVRAGRLVRVSPDLCGPTLSIHAVYPTRKRVPENVRTMVDFFGPGLPDARLGLKN